MKHLPLIAAIALCALFLRLGWWQLQRAGDKQALLDAFAAGMRATPVVVQRYRPEVRFTPVRIGGRFLDYSIYLDNQIRNQLPGVHVFSLFEPAGGGPLLLVNRGWQAMGSDRRVLPTVPPTPVGRTEVSGLLSSFPRPGIRLGEVSYQGPAPLLVPYLEPVALGEALKTEIAPQILLLSERSGDGKHGDPLVRDWTPAIMKPERHRAYALQWFSMAAAVAVIFLVLKVRRRSL